jgi:hypothetical protein
MDRLQDGFHVVAPDYPGFGRSPALRAPTTFDRLAEVTDAFSEAKGLEPPASLDLPESGRRRLDFETTTVRRCGGQPCWFMCRGSEHTN